MSTGQFAEFVIGELDRYRKMALEKDPNWFERYENQKAFLDFQQQVMAWWFVKNGETTDALQFLRGDVTQIKQ